MPFCASCDDVAFHPSFSGTFVSRAGGESPNSLSNIRRMPPVDGGQIAIAGFFVQLGQTLGYSLEHAPIDLSPAAPDESEGSLRGGVWAEAGGQDAIATTAGAIDLLQYKFSRTGKALTLPQLKEIASKLETDWTALPAGRRGVRKLCTYRALTVPAQERWAAARQAWQEGSVTATARKLGALEIDAVNHDAWRRSVSDAARAFGATDEETLHAAETWLGRLLANIAGAGSARVDPRDFAGALVGSRSATPLTANRVATQSSAAADAFRRASPVGPLALVARDESLDAISRLIENHAIVVVTGEGGAGKTVVLAELIRRAPQ